MRWWCGSVDSVDGDNSHHAVVFMLEDVAVVDGLAAEVFGGGAHD